jgi:hypothetical protein
MSVELQVVPLILYHEDVLCWYHCAGTVLLTQYSSGDNIENNKMGGAFSAYWKKGETYTGFWWGNLKERDHFEDLTVDGRIMLKGSSGSGMWGYGLDRAYSGWGQVVRSCECCNEPSGSIKCGEFIYFLKTG